MNITPAERLNSFETGIFSLLNKKKANLIKSGKKVYNLFVGTPDFRPPEHIVNALIESAKKPEDWKYTLSDSDELLQAVADYYKSRYGVTVSPDCITAVNGTQDGMGHIGMALCNRGDIVLLPDPGYPAFEVGAIFGEAEIYYYPIVKENNFLPRLDLIDEDILRKTKYIVLSYPSNPSGAIAPKSMFEEIIKYAKKYEFMIINDNAYSDIVFDDVEGYSFLSVDGAEEVGAEFFSLSKSFNVTGARISFLIGNKQIIEALKLLRSQYDFGMFMPIQKAAIAALKGPRESVKEQCVEYQKRRDALCGGLRKLGWEIPNSCGTMFVWAPLPSGYTSSQEFCNLMIDKAGVICTPGTSFGPSGEGYVRFALVLPAEELEDAVNAIAESGILNK